ncbi:MAG: hypothetical protein ACYDA3_14115 [Gaiellaceae bacterium]
MRTFLRLGLLGAALVVLAPLAAGAQAARTATPHAAVSRASHAAKPHKQKPKKATPKSKQKPKKAVPKSKPKPKPKPPAPPTPPPPNTNPTFSVDVVSTFTRHRVEHLASAPEANGCVFHTDADATEVVTTELAAPVRLTYKQLLAGVQPFDLLHAEEQRNGYYTYGYQNGCPALDQVPRYTSDTSSCGTAAFKIVSDGTALGFIPGTNEFAFTWSYNTVDPFDGHCVHDVFATDEIGNAAGLSLVVPPAGWQTWATLDPASLLDGKQVVVQYNRSGSTGSPDSVSDAYTVSWTVTLTPSAP